MDISSLISSISPCIFPRYRDVLAAAIEQTVPFVKRRGEHAALEDILSDIHFTRDVYGSVAQELGRSTDAVAHTVRRAFNFCWADGKNKTLNAIVGKQLPVKPRPGDLLVCCTFFVCYDKPLLGPQRIGSGGAL